MLPDTTGNVKKRKSTGSLSTTAAKPVKKARHSLDATPTKPTRTIDSFFSPKPSTTTLLLRREGRFILNAQQANVMKMVVDEEKSVFFTGSAGEWDCYPGVNIHPTVIKALESLFFSGLSLLRCERSTRRTQSLSRSLPVPEWRPRT